MDLLDNQKHRQQVDAHHVYRALAYLPEQAEQVWSAATRLTPLRRAFRSVVVAGMGGSALGAHVVQTALADRLRVPMRVVNDYQLPGDVGRDDLVILSSYSGGTEEVLSCLKDAVKRKAQIAGMCAGGALAKKITAHKAPVLLFNARFNPGNVPRYGIGYATFGIAGMLAQFGALQLSAPDVTKTISAMRAVARRVSADVPATRNVAKKLAKKLATRLVLWVGGGHVVGSLHVLQNMTHESGKHMSAYFPLPELNHHLLEGLAHPQTVLRHTTAVVLESRLYHARVAKRVPITKRVLQKNHIGVERLALTAPTVFGQAMEAIVIGGHVGYYLALINRVDPAPNPWVDYFKKALGSP